MANKNTKRKRAARAKAWAQQDGKGPCIVSVRIGKQAWKPKLDKEDEQNVARIRRESVRLYGTSA